MKKTVTLLAALLIISTSQAQNVNIPDVNFKNYLLNNSLINTNSDGEIQVSEAQAFTGEIYAANLSMTTPIADLTGIEAFVNIYYLDVRYNQLANLNLSNNTHLWYVACNDNLLTNIDVSNCTSMEYLYCSNNQLTSIDLSDNTALRDLGCANNQLASLDIYTNTALENVYANNNQLSALSLSTNAALVLLECANNQLTSLNVSNNHALIKLTCNNNQLTSLNVANGNNATVNSNNFQRFWVFNNPNLSCIKVDNSQFSTSNWENGTTANQDVFVYDNAVSFNESCSTAGLTEATTANFKLFPNPATTSFTLTNLPTDATIQLIDQTGRIVKTENATTQTHSISTSALKAGIYFVHVTGKNSETSTQKLVIE